MKNDFIRKPTTAVSSLDEINVGVTLFHACGIWPPFTSEERLVVTRAPIKFRDHPEFTDIQSSLADSVVFDVDWLVNGQSYIQMHFAADGNLGEGGGYNHNYWFKSHDDAATFVAQCREDWMNNPVQIAEEEARRLDWARMDDYDDVHEDEYQ